MQVCSLKDHSDSVFSVAFSPDGKRIVSGSKDKLVKIWDTDTLEVRSFVGVRCCCCCVEFLSWWSRMLCVESILTGGWVSGAHADGSHELGVLGCVFSGWDPRRQRVA